jgi:peptide/nickel transport system substrate-binding protein
MTDALEFRILGPFELVRGGEAIELLRGKPQALLAFLLLHRGEVVSVDRLVEAVWGERAPPTAAKNVQVYVARLRKLVGERVLVTKPPGYVLAVGDHQLDAARFEALVERARTEEPSAAAARLREALALWRGAPLVDFTYDSFAQEEVRRLEELRLSALEERFEADLTLGRHAEVLGELESLANAHPLRERIQGQLMLALYRCGRQAEALAVYQATRRKLVEELGLEPGPSLQQLEQAILRHDPDLAHSTRTVWPLAPAKRVPSGSALAGRRGRLLLVAGAVVLATVAALLAVSLSGGSRVLVASPDSVGVLDGGRNALRAVIATGGTPTGIAAGAGAVWVTDSADDDLLRIDPSLHTVERIPVGHGPTGVAVGSGEVWVVNQLDGTVSEINARAGRQVDEIPVGNGASAIADGLGAIWVANSGEDTISRIDPSRAKVVVTIPLAGAPGGIAVGDHVIWVTSTSTGQLLSIDPHHNRVTQAIGIGNDPESVATGAHAIWVANGSDGTVSRFDPARGEVSKIVVGGSPTGIAYGDGAVWVADGLDGNVWRIDPTTRAVRRIRVGSSPSDLAVAGRDVWTLVLPSHADHRGGTLRIIRQGDPKSVPQSVDPAVAITPAAWLGLSVTNDGLVTYRRVGGLAGSALVPDLATRIPTPSDGGRSYTFQLRSGIHYSNGALVKPSDFRRAIERTLEGQAAWYYAPFYSGIVGAHACESSSRTCDLSRAILADDRAGTVTFRLNAPDPNFLYKLAFPGADAVPAGTPAPGIGRKPLPATGPYMTHSITPGHPWSLVRNPAFRVWSQDAQPDGYPDRIEFRLDATPRETVTAVERGSADVFTNLFVPPLGLVSRFAARYTERFHADPWPATFYLSLNTRIPPFDSPAARRALAFAIDRNKVARLSGGPTTTELTCQVLPPTIPGYRPYCPYTLDPSASGVWSAPNIAEAQRLVHRSGTLGTKVAVLTARVGPTTPSGVSPALARYLVALLDQLGYSASPHRLAKPGDYYSVLDDSRTKTQIAVASYFEDYPAPSNFIDLLLSCRAFLPHNPNNLNLPEFCDHQIDSEIHRAYGLQVHDPARAYRLWARIDRELTDRAPWIPLYNPRVFTGLSARVGNYQFDPFLWGFLIDQLWVR